MEHALRLSAEGDLALDWELFDGENRKLSESIVLAGSGANRKSSARVVTGGASYQIQLWLMSRSAAKLVHG